MVRLVAEASAASFESVSLDKYREDDDHSTSCSDSSLQDDDCSESDDCSGSSGDDDLSFHSAPSSPVRSPVRIPVINNWITQRSSRKMRPRVSFIMPQFEEVGVETGLIQSEKSIQIIDFTTGDHSLLADSGIDDLSESEDDDGDIQVFKTPGRTRPTAGVVASDDSGSDGSPLVASRPKLMRKLAIESSDSEEDTETRPHAEFNETPVKRPLVVRDNSAPVISIGRTPKTPSTATTTANTGTVRRLSKKKQEELAIRYLEEFNDRVFQHRLPSNLELEWCQNLNKTAGKACAYRVRNSETGQIEVDYRVQLSSKVLSTAYMLRNTLAHELCHIAVYAFHGLDGGYAPHGSEFKSYGRQFEHIYSADKVGIENAIEVSTTHSYEIDFKYRYTCTNTQTCGYVYGRHSKSINVKTQVCSRCKSSLVLLSRRGSLISELGRLAKDGTPVKLNAFASFVKENFGRIKQEMASSAQVDDSPVKHRDVMASLGDQWRKLKVSASQ